MATDVQPVQQIDDAGIDLDTPEDLLQMESALAASEAGPT